MAKQNLIKFAAKYLLIYLLSGLYGLSSAANCTKARPISVDEFVGRGMNCSTEVEVVNKHKCIIKCHELDELSVSNLICIEISLQKST